MRMFTQSAVAMTLLASLVAAPKAQELSETITQLTGAAAKEYVKPITSSFGANMNSGWYNKAPRAQKFGIHFEGGAIGSFAWLSGGSKSIDMNGSFRFDATASRNIANQIDTAGTYGQGGRIQDSVAAALSRQDNNVRFVGPTVIGSSDNMRVILEPSTMNVTVPNNAPGSSGDTTFAVDVPGDTLELAGVNGLLRKFPVLPLPIPQVTLGTIYGTNLTLRWLPTVPTMDEIGDVEFFGFGIQHNPAIWLDTKLPVDLSIGYFTQTLKLGDLFEARSNAYGLNVSKQFGWRFLNLTPYGGFMYETSNLDFGYIYTYSDPITGLSEELPVEFSIKGENNFRSTIGLGIRLLAININGDYSFAKYPTASLGVMLSL
jgi:hypothetical protein